MARCPDGRRFLWLAVAACITAGCGGASAGPPAHPNILWRTSEESEPTEPWPGGILSPRRELAKLDLAQAANAGIDTPSLPADHAWSNRRHHGFIVNLESYGRIYFKGYTWPVHGDRRSESLERLSRKIRTLVRELPTEERGSPFASFTFRIDREWTWSDVMDILKTVSEAGGPTAGWRFAVASPAAWRDYPAPALDASRGGAPPAGAVSVAVALAIHRGGVPRLNFAGRSLGFAPGPLYSPETLPIANRNWAELRAALVAARARGPTALDLEIGDDVPWAYVVQTFAVSLDAGVPDVSVRGTDFHLTLSTPSMRSLPHYGTRDPRDWPTWVALAIGVAAAFVLFGWGLVRPHRPARRRAAA